MDLVAKSSFRERTELFGAAEHRHTPKINAAIIEKDFWVCWTLRRLFEVLQFRPQLIFKGGTSLSKVFNAIERFSEDVDLSLSRRDLGFADDKDPEQAGISKKEQNRRLDDLTSQCKQSVREHLLPALRRDFATVLGDAGWSVDLDTEDPQIVIFSYPASELSGNLPYVKPSIRLEMGARSDDWPAVEADIKPYAAEAFPRIFTMPTCKVRALTAVRTFWEKATLLHAEFHRPLGKPLKARMSRHYYDLYRLSCQDISRKALESMELLERVVQHKCLFFAQAWANYRAATPGTFRLVPSSARINELRKDYEEMKAMIFGESPKWDEIVRGLKQLEDQINNS
ncbi:nucleotidyl transferase AbiEii/AbiGii toxin family protein [Elusimicrobiota bacterium]